MMQRTVLRPSLIILLILATANLPARAQTHTGILFEPWQKGIWGQTVDKIFVENKEDVEGGGKAQTVSWESTGRFRFGKDNPDAPVIGFRTLSADFNTSNVTPGIPDQLEKIELAGGLYLGRVDDGKVYAMAGIGYAGDKPFGNLGNSTYGTAHLLWNKPLDDCNTLLLSLDYNGGSAFLPDVPLPGFGYVHADDYLGFTFGFPRNSIIWHICDHLELLGQYTVPYTVDAYLNYEISQHWSLFANFANLYDAFVLIKHDRSDHLFETMRRVEGGIHFAQRDFFHGLELDVAGIAGYAFDQNFETGFDVRNATHLTNFSDQPYVGMILRGTF
jgi:hypothetical protein